MLASIESFFHRLRRRFSRSEWAIRKLRLAVAENSGEMPGLLLIQIGGLSRSEMEKAIEAGRMPYLKRLLERERYHHHAFNPGVLSTVPAMQAELYYGASTGGFATVSDADGARSAEDKLSSGATGLLDGGSSWANIYRGGAKREESHFCLASPGTALWRSSRVGDRVLFLFMEIPAVFRIASSALLELVTGFGGLLRGRNSPLKEAGLRQVITIGAKLDLVRGLPIVHVNFTGYGQVAHHRGLDSTFARWSLRGIDNAVRAISVEALRSQRRDYHVWIFSDDQHGFLLVPPATWLPHETAQPVSPSDLRLAALTLLNRQPVPSAAGNHPPFQERLAVMSYNVHSCIGMDGRVSPRRIARVIARQRIDIVALQEIDHGRARSRAEDQAGEIALELGFHLIFCPAVVRGDERYGHALLSRWPLEQVKIGLLPSHPGGVWPEPRAALWARAQIGNTPINILSTHLGLSAPERMKQMTAILGPEWLGPVLDREPVVLCGDFNLTPGGATHRLAASRLRDVAHDIKRGVHTFSSIRLVAQLDHIFVSPDFGIESVFAVQNDLTRVASDHLPLVAQLRMPGKQPLAKDSPATPPPASTLRP